MVTPIGYISKAIEALRQSVAASITFQTLTGAGDASAALAFIYLHEIPEPADGSVYTAAELATLRPCAVIGDVESTYFSPASGAADDRGTLRLKFLYAIDGADTVPDGMTTLDNYVGEIIREITELGWTGAPYFAARNVMLDPQSRERFRDSEEDKQGRFVTRTATLDWGNAE